jgi:hypothetical protein
MRNVTTTLQKTLPGTAIKTSSIGRLMMKLSRAFRPPREHQRPSEDRPGPYQAENASRGEKDEEGKQPNKDST